MVDRIHWRTRDARDVVTVYGLDPSGLSRIADPAEPAHTFMWLPDAQFDSRGNAVQYEYTAETGDGVDFTTAYEQSRRAVAPAQRYLKRVRYGNTKPLRPDVPVPGDNSWLFEVVLDYGDHADTTPAPTPDSAWLARPDPYSTYRPGFEVRTYRLCRRLLLFHRFDALGPEPVLVSAYQLEHTLHPAGSTLAAVHHTRFRSDAEHLSQRSVPPLRLQYSEGKLAPGFELAPDETSQNVPYGIDVGGYRWIDLYGEGLPGILPETGRAWYYKPNEGGGHFGPQSSSSIVLPIDSVNAR